MKKNKGILGIVITIVILVGAGIGINAARKGAEGSGSDQSAAPQAAAVRVVLASARSMRFEMRVTATGSVESKYRAMVPARLKGTLEAIYVDEGDAVVAGETKLFKIDDLKATQAEEIARQQYAVAECSVREKEANRDRVQADYDKAKLDYERFKRLYEQDKAVTKNAFELQESRFKQLAASLKHATVLVELAGKQKLQAESALAITRKDLQDTMIVAPISGTISRRFMEPGEMGDPGKPVVQIDDLSVLEVSVFLPEAYYPAIRLGETTMQLRVNGVVLDNATVTFKSPDIHPTLRTFEVKTRIEAPPEAVVPGAMAHIVIPLSRRQGVGVPSKAIVQRGDASVVFTIENGVAHMRPVKTGITTDGWIEITDGSVRDGQEIAVMGQFYLNDNASVTVVEGGE